MIRQNLWSCHGHLEKNYLSQGHGTGGGMEAYAWCWRVKETQSYFYFRKITFKKWDIGIPHLIILFFIVLCLHCISFLFLQTEGLWQPCMEQIYWSHFSNSVCSLCVCVSDFGDCHSISNFFIITVIVTVICHQWSSVLLIQLLWGTTNNTDSKFN